MKNFLLYPGRLLVLLVALLLQLWHRPSVARSEGHVIKLLPSSNCPSGMTDDRRLNETSGVYMIIGCIRLCWSKRQFWSEQYNGCVKCTICSNLHYVAKQCSAGENRQCILKASLAPPHPNVSIPFATDGPDAKASRPSSTVAVPPSLSGPPNRTHPTERSTPDSATSTDGPEAKASRPSLTTTVPPSPSIPPHPPYQTHPTERSTPASAETKSGAAIANRSLGAKVSHEDPQHGVAATPSGEGSSSPSVKEKGLQPLYSITENIKSKGAEGFIVNGQPIVISSAIKFFTIHQLVLSLLLPIVLLVLRL